MAGYELLTNEWLPADGNKPWKGREVLVKMSDGTKRILAWNGVYWVDPATNIRQFFSHNSVYPVKFYIFEKDNDETPFNV